MKKYLYLFFLFFIGCNMAASRESKYADAADESIRHWLHQRTIFQLTLTSPKHLYRKNIDLYNETIQCYDKITVDSERDAVMECFVYDFIAHYIGLNSLQIDGIKNDTKGSGLTSGGGRLYEALLKIGVPEDEIKMTSGIYYLTGFSLLRTFINSRKELEESNSTVL